MKTISALALALSLGLLAADDAAAQQRGASGLAVLLPTADMSDAYTVGISVTGDAEYPLADNTFLALETGYQTWQAEDLPNGDAGDAENTFSVGLGVKQFMGSAFIGADANYYLLDFNEFALRANAGMRLGKVNIELSFAPLDPVTFVGVEIGYFWRHED